MTGGKEYYHPRGGTEIGILCLWSAVLGWSLGDARVRLEFANCKVVARFLSSPHRICHLGIGVGSYTLCYLAMMAALDHVCTEPGTVPDPDVTE